MFNAFILIMDYEYYSMTLRYINHRILIIPLREMPKIFVNLTLNAQLKIYSVLKLYNH